jgi:hypothetical protein
MGTIGTVLDDNQAFFYNPASLTFSEYKHTAITVAPINHMPFSLPIVGDSYPDIWTKGTENIEENSSASTYRTLALSARTETPARIGESPIVAGVGYFLIDVPYPYRRYSGTGRPNTSQIVFGGTDWGSPSYTNKLHTFSAALGYSGFCDASVGASYKFTNAGFTSTGLFDFGLMGRLTIHDSRPDSIQMSTSSRTRLLTGATVRNVGNGSGDFVEYPTLATLGIGIDYATFSGQMPAFSVQMAGEYEGVISEGERSTWRVGAEFGIVEMLFLRVGYLAEGDLTVPPSDEFMLDDFLVSPQNFGGRTFEGDDYTTLGASFSTRGLRRVLKGNSKPIDSGDTSFWEYLQHNANLRVSYSRVGTRRDMTTNWDYLAIELTL